MPIQIPTDILEAARASDITPTAVSAWFYALLTERGIPIETSPADYPEDVWEAFHAISEASMGALPVANGNGLRELFRQIDTPA